MGEEQRDAGTLALLGGRTCLEFSNTVDWRLSDQPVEYLTNYGALVAWGRHVGILDENQAEHLLAEAARRPSEAGAVQRRAVLLREAIYRAFAAISDGQRAEDDDLAILNDELSTALAELRIVSSGEGYRWDGGDVADALDHLLWPVARDAAELLTSEDLDRVGQCHDDRCGWLFLDTSRNRSRRWCSMEDCGNRAKARRYYRRSRSSTEQ